MVDPTADKEVERIMIFSSNGRIYKTDELNCFETGDVNVPVIYLDPISARVFIQTPGQFKADFEEIDGERLRELAGHFRLQPVVDQLLRMLHDTGPASGPSGSGAGMPQRAQDAMDQMKGAQH